MALAERAAGSIKETEGPEGSPGRNGLPTHIGVVVGTAGYRDSWACLGPQ